jgi:hypothetical protein
VYVAADRDHQAPADGELLLQCLGDFRPAGGDHDGVERGRLRPALGAVGADDLHVVIAELRFAGLGQSRKLLVPLDGIDLIGNAPHHRRRIAGPGADLEHIIAGPQFGQLDHAGNDIRLGDSLPGLDRERRVFVGELGQRLRHESLAWDLAHGPKHLGIGNTARPKMTRDHESSIAREAVVLLGMFRICCRHRCNP